jgi:membrane protease YdiL (CAAX protease family)
MLALSVAIIWLFSKGKLNDYGFTLGSYRFSPRILLWGLPTAALSLVALASSDGQPAGALNELAKPQLIIFIWIYASISEEVLTRGLLQTLLSGGSGDRVQRRRLSTPVLVSGLFFGAMHLGLLESMGPEAVPVIIVVVFLGLVAARYRERTGSLVPAIIIHALFNVGGMLPLWIVQWLTG